jgi:Cysteine-rich secretory protein family
VVQDERVPAGWTGSTAGCLVGTESPASLAATLRTINMLRAFAGLAPVVLDEQLDRRALAAALMMHAANRLSHEPDPGWPCYSAEGAAGAGSSNLFLGRSGAAAMVGYVDDAGVASLGHRRWLLSPEGAVFGSGSTGSTNALLVIGGPDAPVAPNTAVAWPPSGWVPWQWIFRDWTLALGSSGQVVTFANPQVTVTIDGAPAAVGAVTLLGGGYGAGQTLRWQVGIDTQPTAGDHTIGVTVQGAIIDGQLQAPLTWTTYAFQPDPPAPRFVTGPRIRRPGGARPSRVRPGQRLVASATVTGGSVTRSRWLRDGRPIGDARTSIYRVKQRDRGHALSVTLTATATGGERTTTRTSSSVRIRR